MGNKVPSAPTTVGKWKKVGLTVGAVALAVVLLGVFIHRAGNFDELCATLKSAVDRPAYLISGVALFSVSLLCGMTRWYILLRTLKLPVSYLEALRLYATGHFFNVIGPGATGGDFVKAAWIAVKCPDRRTAAITSIAAERLIGLIAMVFFVTTISFFRRDFFDHSRILTAFRSCIYLACAGSVIVVLLLTIIDWERVAKKLHPAPGSLAEKILTTLLHIWRTFRVCLTHPLATVATFALSITNHITDVCCYYLLSRSISMTLPLRDLLVISPIANTVAAIPITPGGAGVRENTLQFMMDVANVPRTESTALGILMFGTIIFWAIIAGGIMATGFRTRKVLTTPHPKTVNTRATVISESR